MCDGSVIDQGLSQDCHDGTFAEADGQCKYDKVP